MTKKYLAAILILLLMTIAMRAEDGKDTVLIPKTVFTGKTIPLKEIGQPEKVIVNGKEMTGPAIEFDHSGEYKITIVAGGKTQSFNTYAIHGLLTILPPILAIILALLFKEVILALFLGILAGSLFINRFDVIAAFFNVIDKYILEALADKERASIVIFTLFLGGMVGIISRSGGVQGIVDSLSRRVRSARTTQLYTWLMGILIFFDDYTNTLIVGNTMRPLTDKWKISREKLSYIVDSTAAPMASIAIISTWIGFEISLINQSLKAYNIDFDAYNLFLSSLPYRFYPFLALLFVFLIFTIKKDFGPMWKAEIRAHEGKVLRDDAIPLADFESSGLSPAPGTRCRWYNGLIPIIVVIVFTFGGLYISGKSSLLQSGDPLAHKSLGAILFSGSLLRDLGSIISSADSFQVLLWASLMGAFTALTLAVTQRILHLRDGVTAFVQGMKSMMMAVVILILAWSLGVVLDELRTADFLVSLLSSHLDYHLLPAIVFILSAFIAFSTGSSWGTIGIMYPLVIPITIGITQGTQDFKLFLVLSISSVLAGGVFGDHCSPISDTTIMSSMASSCDHIDHVKTQIPYSLLVALISLLLGIIPVSFGFPYAISIILSISACAAVIMIFGKPVNAR